MTTFIADYIFGTRRRPSRPAPSLAQRLNAAGRADTAQSCETNRETAGTLPQRNASGRPADEPAQRDHRG
jgi:hypothetical protein